MDKKLQDILFLLKMERITIQTAKESIFSLFNVSVLSDLKEWCYDNCNESNSDRLHEILDRLDKR